jgi:hypothetical protein
MTKEKMFISIGIGFIIFIISFFISLTANLWQDALMKATVVFIVSSALMAGMWLLLGYINRNDQADESTAEQQTNMEDPAVEHEDQMLGEKLHQEEGKGSHIDLQTPEDEEFKPLELLKSSKHSE